MHVDSREIGVVFQRLENHILFIDADISAGCRRFGESCQDEISFSSQGVQLRGLLSPNPAKLEPDFSGSSRKSLIYRAILSCEGDFERYRDSTAAITFSR